MPTYNHNYDDYDQPSTSRRAGFFIGLGLVVVVVAALLYLTRLSHPKLVPAPTAYVPFQAADSSFSVDAPAGWHNAAGTAGAISANAKFTKGDAKIAVSSDLEGSLYGDMQQAQNAQLENMASLAGTPPPVEVPPVEKVHEMAKADVASRYQDYVELPMQTVTSKLGDGRISEFTAQGGTFVGPLHGYRATFLSSDSRIQVITVCPQRNWAILQPAFMRVIESVGRGTPH